MATEAEIKAKERKELLDEIRKRRAAAAYGEGVVGAAERGEYGDVGQGGPKGEFDDEINQDPGNEDVTQSRMSLVDFLTNYLTDPRLSATGAGIDLLGRLGAVTAPYTQKPLETISQGGDNIVQKAGKFLFEDAAKVAAKINSGVSFDELEPFEKLAIASVPAEAIPGLGLAPDILKMAKNFAVNVGKTGIKTIGDITESLSSRMETAGAPNVDNINFMTGSKSGATDSKVVYNPQKNYDDLVDSKPQKSVKISSTVDEPDLSKLEVTGTDGNSYVLVGDRLVPKEMAEIRGYVLKEGDRANPRISYNYVLKSRDDLIREKTGSGLVKIGNRQVPYEDTILVTGKDGKTYRIINPDAYKVREASGELPDQKVFNTYLSNNKTIQEIVSNDKNINSGSLNRYLNFIRVSSPQTGKIVDGKADDFMKDFKLEIEDLKNPNSLFYKQYEYFKQFDKVREQAGKKIKPILDIIYPAKKEGRKASNSLQIAHRFMNTQIGKSVPEGLAGTGGTPSAYYLDISEFNALVQPSLEREAREAVASGSVEAIKIVDKKLKKIGAEINVDGVKLGQHKFVEEKLLEEAGKLKSMSPKELQEKGITLEMINDFYEGIDMISKGASNLGIKAMNKGGLVGIRHLTRPL